MFRPARVILLLLVSLLITAGLYLADSDTGSDSLAQTGAMLALVLLVVTILYAAGYGLSRTWLRRSS